MAQTVQLVQRSLLIVGLAIFTVGCGEATQSIGGTVTLDGEPLPNGQIIFHQSVGEGKSVVSDIKNGTYSASLISGEKRVEVIAYRVTGKDEYGGDKKEPYIPKKYNEQSTLTVDINSSSGDSVDFTLKSK